MLSIQLIKKIYLKNVKVESYEEKLIKELGDKLTPLGIPGIAIFTLTVGIMLTTFIFVVVICRIHRGRISFR